MMTRVRRCVGVEAECNKCKYCANPPSLAGAYELLPGPRLHTILKLLLHLATHHHPTLPGYWETETVKEGRGAKRRTFRYYINYSMLPFPKFCLFRNRNTASSFVSLREGVVCVRHLCCVPGNSGRWSNICSRGYQITVLLVLFCLRINVKEILFTPVEVSTFVSVSLHPWIEEKIKLSTWMLRQDTTSLYLDEEKIYLYLSTFSISPPSSRAVIGSTKRW